MTKIQEAKTGQLTITLPRQICRMKGWKKGTLLTILANEKGELILKEIKLQ